MRFQIEFLIGTHKENVEILPGPAHPDFSSVLGFRPAMRIALHVDRFCAAPKRRSRICIEARIRLGPTAPDDGISSEGASAPRYEKNQHSEKTIHERFLPLEIGTS
jgi:hypothetical protein